MIAKKDSIEPTDSNGNGGTRAVVSQNDNGADSAAPSNQLPNSKKLYVDGVLHPTVRVPFREISLAPTKTMNGQYVNQIWYARQGIITPEMELIAIRENCNAEVRDQRSEIRNSNLSTINSQPSTSFASNDLRHSHPGESFGAGIPREITPEF